MKGNKTQIIAFYGKGSPKGTGGSYGIGIREGGFIFFLGLKGISAEKALTLSLSFFAIQIAASLIGGLAYAFGLQKKVLEDYAEKM